MTEHIYSTGNYDFSIYHGSGQCYYNIIFHDMIGYMFDITSYGRHQAAMFGTEWYPSFRYAMGGAYSPIAYFNFRYDPSCQVATTDTLSQTHVITTNDFSFNMGIPNYSGNRQSCGTWWKHHTTHVKCWDPNAPPPSSRIKYTSGLSHRSFR